MHEALLIEEAGDRAMTRINATLPLVLLAFEAGEAEARRIAAAEPERVLDPVARACFGEARELLLRPAATAREIRANLFASMFALEVAAEREPACFAALRRAIRTLAFEGLAKVVELELAADDGDGHSDASADTSPPGQVCN